MIKIRVITSNTETAAAELSKAVQLDKWRVDQGLAVIRKSGAPSPKSLKILYLVHDHDAAPQWNGIPWKVGHVVSLTM